MRLAALLAVTGCSFNPTPAGEAIDAPPVVPDQVVVNGDTTVDCMTWMSTHFDACMLPEPPGDVHLTAGGSPYTYDTTTNGGTLVDSGNTPIAITNGVLDQSGNPAAIWTVTGLSLDPGVTLLVVGNKPLIIAAWNSIENAGTIDAGSYTGIRNGAGSNAVTCSGHAPGNGVQGDSGTGGGGGGAFGGAGSAGGQGDGNGSVRAGGTAGTAQAAPAIVVGGCNGANSGMDTVVGNFFAAGGTSGGALLLAARISITISGSVLAGGGGGHGDTSGVASVGGGGGGSGGLIGLEATTLTVSGTLAANGGAGGGGAVKTGTGTDGGNGKPDGTAASGGTSTIEGETGGSGSSINVPDGGAVTLGGTGIPNGGGGGGGGGAGFILRWSTAFAGAGSTISPPIQAL